MTTSRTNRHVGFVLGIEHTGGVSTAPEEVPLIGGRANAGQVMQVGDQVARPMYPQTASVEHFLRHLISCGLDFVPAPFPHDELGRQRLEFLPGSVPLSPYPTWALSESLLADVARHQRELHRAAESYVAPDDAIWAVSAGDYFPDAAAGTLVCHNDLCMSNVVVVDGRVAGIIDFDYCRPVDRLFDIAVAARHWVPFGGLASNDVPDVDRVHRFVLFADAHELDTADRAHVVSLSISFLDKARDNVRRLADEGKVGFQNMLKQGYEASNRATVDWLRTNADSLSR